MRKTNWNVYLTRSLSFAPSFIASYNNIANIFESFKTHHSLLQFIINQDEASNRWKSIAAMFQTFKYIQFYVAGKYLIIGTIILLLSSFDVIHWILNFNLNSNNITFYDWKYNFIRQKMWVQNAEKIDVHIWLNVILPRLIPLWKRESEFV